MFKLGGFKPVLRKALGKSSLVLKRIKPELFTDKAEVGKVATAFNAAANDLAKAAATGDKAAVKKAFSDTGAACKGCHDKFRQE